MEIFLLFDDGHFLSQSLSPSVRLLLSEGFGHFEAIISDQNCSFVSIFVRDKRNSGLDCSYRRCFYFEVYSFLKNTFFN